MRVQDISNRRVDNDLLPPIKWPGGKTKEYPYIKTLIPSFDRYIEPFFGGGAIYFILRPARAVINDFSRDLVDFYRFLKGEYSSSDFADELYQYVDNWEKIPKYIELFNRDLITLFSALSEGKLSESNLRPKVYNLVHRNEHHFNGLFSENFCIDRTNLETRIVDNITSKLVRTNKIAKKHNGISPGDLDKNIETAFRSGFYMHFRDLLNKKHSNSQVSAAKYTANYYFIREFCYGAMFRYNSKGEFNIPYGGIAYNTKDFRKKVDLILSDKYKDAFRGAQMENGDFADALLKYEVNKDDFIFLDPPYDSDFSEYDNNGFSPDDHRRLAEFVKQTDAKCMLLIKETEFIRSLYEGAPGVNISSFGKKYLYNVKGRNDQNANHLIICNYSL